MIRIVVCMLLCMTIVLPVASQTQKKENKKSPDRITVFAVNKKPVTAAEFIYLFSKNPQNSADAYSPQKIEEYLDLLINFKLKVEEARHRGLDTTAAFRKEYNSYKDELRKPYLPDASLTDSLVKFTYNRMKEEVKAAHILISVKPDASPEDTLKAYQRIVEIRNKILAGEDFETAAATYSEDPSAKMNKGLLGYFTALQMVYPFENAAYTTKIGDISKPIRTRFGYHILKVYDRRPAQGEVEVAHIMIRTGVERDNEKAKNTIFEVYDKLQAGVPWEDLCKEYSEDPGSKDNGGKLRPFGVGVMANVPEFEKTAFSLQEPGDISDPFQTQYGWHILRLERKIPLAALDELSASLKSRVARDERTQISKQALQAKLRRDLQLKENAATKAKAFALADSSLTKGKWKMPTLPKTKEPLFTIQGSKYTLNGFADYVLHAQRPTTLTPQKYIDQLYNNYIDASILDKQEEKILAAHPDYGYLLKEYYEGILLFDIMEDEVWNKASEDSLGQLRYFQEHYDSYKTGERVKGAIYSASSPSELEGLAKLIAGGDERKIQEEVASKHIKYESGYFKRDDKAILAKIPWTAGVHSAENNGIYYLAWLKNILPPGPMSFEEAGPTVISDYQNALEKQWIVELKKKYPVKVDEKGKQYILQQLKK